MARTAEAGKPNDTKALIILNAGRLIGAHGFGAISVADIAGACGMTKQALLYHFESKEALKEAVVEHLLEHANAALLSLLSTVSGDANERIEHALSSLETLFKREPWVAQVVLRLFLDGDQKAVSRLSQGTLPWARYAAEEIRRGAKDGRFRELPDPEGTLEQLAMLLLTNFALLAQRGWNDEEPKKSRSRKITELVRLVRLILFK